MTPSTATRVLSVAFCLLSLDVTRAVAAAERRSLSSIWRRASNSRNVPPSGFYDPRSGGGEWLTVVNGTFPPGLGEPLNAIISGNSDDAVLVDQMDNGGLRNFFQSIGFSAECLGQHDSSDQAANLGDGNGFLNETATIRWNYGDPTLGTCKETVEGGNHFRYWVQDGKNANSGAIFLGVSYELPIKLDHDIIDNGYNLARDWLVGNATSNTSIPTADLTNTSSYGGQSSASGYTYQTSVIYASGLLPNTSDGINHFQTVGNITNAVDGLVAVLTVKITQQPERATSQSTSLPAYWLPSGALYTFLPILAYFLFAHRL